MSVIKQLNIRDAVPVTGPVDRPPPLKVGVLVDLALTTEAGGHVKCWQRLAEAATGHGDWLDLTVHFNGPEPRRIELSPSVRYVLLPPVFSTARLIRRSTAPSGDSFSDEVWYGSKACRRISSLTSLSRIRSSLTIATTRSSCTPGTDGIIEGVAGGGADGAAAGGGIAGCVAVAGICAGGFATWELAD